MKPWSYLLISHNEMLANLSLDGLESCFLVSGVPDLLVSSLSVIAVRLKFTDGERCGPLLKGGVYA